MELKFGHKALVPARVAWKKHPDKCWDVLFDPARQGEGFYNGMELQLWDCEKARKFILPAGGFGPIKLADRPDYCLDALGKSTTLWFWDCDAAPRKNILWSVPQGRSGIIQPVNDNLKCVDVPNDDPTNGNKIQQWSCEAHHEDQHFEIVWPTVCAWSDWSEWSMCSPSCKKFRRRHERPEGQEDVKEARCVSSQDEVHPCTDCHMRVDLQ